MTNLVAELTGLREFQLTERPLPDPGHGEVQVRVGAVGICGSDLHSYAEGSVGDQVCRYPMVLGHEPAGIVVKTGPGVSGWSAGDEAALEPAIYCYHCTYCLSGHHNVCAHIRFMSSVDDAGFFRERVNLPARNLLPLCRGVGLREATLIEPLAIVCHSLKYAPPKLGDRVAVIGAGPMGLLTIAALKLAGASRIWAVESVAHRRDLAFAMGADPVIDPAQVDPVQEILRDCGNSGVDSVYDCAAKGNSLAQAINIVRSCGSVILTGIHSEVNVPINVHNMRRKEIALFSVRRSNHESEQARTLLAQHARLFAPLITHERPLNAIRQSFDMAECYADGVGKVLIRPNEMK